MFKQKFISKCHNIVHKSQKAETQTSIKGWIDEQNVVHLYNEILFNHKKDWSTVRVNPNKVMLKEGPDTKGFMSYDSMCMKRPRQANPQRTETCGSKGQAGREENAE